MSFLNFSSNIEKKKIIIFDILIYAISKIIPALIGLIFLTFFIRILGAVEFGRYSYLLSQFNLITAICFGWLNQSQIRYGNIENANQKKIIYKQYFILSLSISFPIILAFSFIKNFPSSNLILAFFVIFSISLFSFLKSIFQSVLMPKKVFLLTIVQSILAIGLPVIFINIYVLDANNLLFFVGLSFSISAIISYLINRNYFNIVYRSKEKSDLKKWLSFGIPISIWGSIGLLLIFLDRYFIIKYLDFNSLGIYSSLNELTTKAFSFLILPLTLAIHPRITKLWNDEKKKEALILINISIILIFIIVLLALFILVFYKESIFSLIKIIIPVLTKDYIDVMSILILTGVLWQLSLLAHKIIELKENTYMMIIFISFSVLINMIGNIYFLPKFGIIATAYTSLCSASSYCFFCLIYYLYHKRFIL